MRILGIESSSLVAGVAILEDENIIAEYNVNYKKTHSQTLLPMLEEIVSRIDFDLQTIDAIAISSGPGSFTGLRIGVATAKGLGLGLDKPLIAVPTLDATAYNISNTKSLICPIMDARRQQVYTGIFRNDKEFEVVEAAAAMDINDLLEKLKGSDSTVDILKQIEARKGFYDSISGATETVKGHISAVDNALKRSNKFATDKNYI